MHTLFLRRCFGSALVALFVLAAAAGGLLWSGSDQASAGGGPVRAGFDATMMPPNDDESTGLVPMGFTANFFGTDYTELYVNTNGNVTFDEALGTFTPFDLTSTGTVIIAPFFADVDTRSGNQVAYGTGTVDGRSAFGVTWPLVGCYEEITHVQNNFQVLLIDRSDIAAGDFDIEFNYNQIEWETGEASDGDSNCLGGDSARVGYSNGTGDPGTFFELAGSAVNGAFLDTNMSTGLIHNSLNTSVLGRYIFRVRGGIPEGATPTPTPEPPAPTDTPVPGAPTNTPAPGATPTATAAAISLPSTGSGSGSTGAPGWLIAVLAGTSALAAGYGALHLRARRVQ